MVLEKLLKISDKEFKTLTEQDIIEIYKPLVEGEAFRFCIKTGSFQHEEDYIQSGYIGLVKAFRSYDLSKNVLFYTYALQCIKTEIRNYFRKSVYKTIGMVSLDEQYKDEFSSDKEFSFMEQLQVEDFSDVLLEALANKQFVEKISQIIEKFTETQKTITKKY